MFRKTITITALALAFLAASGAAFSQTAQTGCTPQDSDLANLPLAAVGTNAYAGGGDSYAQGDGATAEGLRDFAIGTGSFAGGSVGDASTACDYAIGDTSMAEGLRDFAIGTDAYAAGSYSIAAGDSAHADGLETAAVGAGAYATGDQSVALGAFANASGAGAAAVGAFANVSGVGAAAIGEGATAAGDNSVALGAGSYADRGDAVSVGDDGTDGLVAFQRQITNVAAGTQPFDAVNLQQLDEALRSANSYTDLRSIDTLNQADTYTDMRVGQLNLRVNYALAAAASNANAAAAVAAQDPDHHNRVAVSDGLASGVNAWTFMYQHKADSGVTWNISLTGEQGGGSSSERQVGVGVGYSW